jgi:hypothetical protein
VFYTSWLTRDPAAAVAQVVYMINSDMHAYGAGRVGSSTLAWCSSERSFVLFYAVLVFEFPAT